MTITKKNIKTGCRSVAASELKKMLPVFIAGSVILILTSTVFCISAGVFDYRLFSGVLAGNLFSAGYFLTLGIATENALMRKNSKKTRFSANLWYGARYAGLFCVYIFLLYFNTVNVFTSVIPLFFPRIYYFLTLLKKD